MDDRPPWGFWIAGTAAMLFVAGCTALPLFLFAGGKPAFEFLLATILLFIEYAPAIAGVLVPTGIILLIVRLVNRRRRFLL